MALIMMGPLRQGSNYNIIIELISIHYLFIIMAIEKSYLDITNCLHNAETVLHYALVYNILILLFFYNKNVADA